MDFEEFKNIFIQELTNNGINIDVDYEKFYNYMKELLEWNKNINLTAIKDEKEFIIKHFLDSLTITNLISENDRVIDIGTGAGFPGIPLKIVNKKIKITLVDSVNKKIMVLNDIIEKLNLEDIKAIHNRAEEMAHKQEYREMFDVATSRAVANLATLVEYLIPFVKIGGKIICMKGPNSDIEIKNAKNAISKLGGNIEEVLNFKLDNELERNIIIIRKTKETPEKYPRLQGLPLKKPL